MTSTHAEHGAGQVRTYTRSSSVVFLKTKERYGGLSNMAGGFPLEVNGLRIPTSEALYQACRFPHRPELQRLIIEQRSPMTAKMKSKPYRQDSRPDWNRVRVRVMRWCLRVKLAQNWTAFRDLLASTGDRPIVEQSHKDDFWGAKPVDEEMLVGVNALGRLLMELRERIRCEPADDLLRIAPLHISDFRLYGQPVEAIVGGRLGTVEAEHEAGSARWRRPRPVESTTPLQLGYATRGGSSTVREDSQEYAAALGGGRLRSYPVYKDSGVEGLGKVPAHWEVLRLKSWLSINKHVLSEDTDPECTFDYVDIGSVGTGRLTSRPERMRFGDSPSRARRVVRSGDTIVSTVRTYLKGVWHAEHNGTELIASTGFAVLTPRRGTVSRFVSYLCQSNPFANRVTAESVGMAYPAIAEARLGTFDVCVPPFPEQAAIVRCLDHADRRIRRYIHAKEKLIALLEEQKQAIIHEAVTGRIDVCTGRRYPVYKDSGVAWLGQVPDNWEVRRSKRVFRPRKELARPGDVQLSATQAYGVIAQEDYEAKIGRKVTRILRHLEQRRHVEVDDFVISMRSFQGGLERAWEGGCIRSSYIVLRADTTVITGYFGYLFKSIGYIAALQSTADFIRDGQDLNFENFCRVEVPYPPVEEQRRIALALDEAIRHIGSRIERSRKEIDLLREYRTRLIADVVTGKLDVRDAATVLPKVDPLAAEDDLDDGSDQTARSDDQEAEA